MAHKKKTKTTRLHIYIDADLRKFLEDQAKAQQRSISNLIRIYILSARVKEGK